MTNFAGCTAEYASTELIFQHFLRRRGLILGDEEGKVLIVWPVATLSLPHTQKTLIEFTPPSHQGNCLRGKYLI